MTCTNSSLRNFNQESKSSKRTNKERNLRWAWEMQTMTARSRNALMRVDIAGFKMTLVLKTCSKDNNEARESLATIKDWLCCEESTQSGLLNTYFGCIRNLSCDKGKFLTVESETQKCHKIEKANPPTPPLLLSSVSGGTTFWHFVVIWYITREH